jgi:hypothetical protein
MPHLARASNRIRFAKDPLSFHSKPRAEGDTAAISCFGAPSLARLDRLPLLPLRRATRESFRDLDLQTRIDSLL